ncbi:MAG: TonB-dependent copper receptor [Chromatiales bacterium]|nr:TonB-dependent copper receptor [Gammaproteobacteria bacterium]MCP5351591.1 TonB-dependent copper receptor [Chromatiales bacterium]
MSRFRVRPLTALIAAVLSAPAAHAESLGTVEVEATPIDLPTMKVERGAVIAPSPSSDAGEALRAVPGVSGSRMGGHGIDPVIRGQTQTQLNILLDGAYVHGGCPNRMDPPTAYAPIETFDKVTIIKGSQTVRYGGGGSGGTVLLEREGKPLSAGETLRGKVGAGYRGNSDTKDGFADLTVGNETSWVRGIATAKDADNYKDGDGVEVRSAYAEKALNLQGGFINDATRIDVGIDLSRSDDILFAGAGMDSPQADADTYRLRVRHDAEVGPFAAIDADISVAEVTHVMDNYTLRNQTGTRMRAPSTSDTVSGRLSGDIAVGESIWTVGVDFQNNEREADRYNDTANNKNSVLWPGVEIDQSGVFAELDMPMGERDVFKAGVRYDRVEASASRAGEKPAMLAPNTLYTMYYGTTARDVSEDNVGGFLRYEKGLDSVPGIAWVGLSRSVRTADATERYMASNGAAASRWIGNPNIDPEQHHQIEVGLDIDWGDVAVNGAVYYNDVSDYILRDAAHGQTGILLNDNATIYRNVDAELYGYEIGGALRFDANWSMKGSLAYVHATNTSDNRAIAQTPPLEGTVNLDYATTGWSVGTQLRVADKQTRVDDDVTTGSGLDVGQTAGYWVFDVYGTVAPTKTSQVRFGVDNLFDEAYANHLNRSNSFDPTQVQVNEPGRSVWARFNWSF